MIERVVLKTEKWYEVYVILVLEILNFMHKRLKKSRGTKDHFRQVKVCRNLVPPPIESRVNIIHLHTRKLDIDLRIYT